MRGIEWLTGKRSVLQRVARFQTAEVPTGAQFWSAVVQVMGIDVATPAFQLERIPASGPVVLVANHPHGVVDGMVLADLLGRKREDFRILTRVLLNGLDPSAGRYMIPVPFLHEPQAQRKMVDMRAQAMAHLDAGGLVALFPAGAVATSTTAFGPVTEGDWSPFTAKMIRRSGATVVPVYFEGANSRLYQIANRLSPVLRQALLMHEIVRIFDMPQAPIIGKPMAPEDWADPIQIPRQFMAYLRSRTLALQNDPDGVPVFKE